jgi:hypothetical protein
VLTVSFHKYGNYFFPGTGDIRDIGERHGRYYSINVPMRDGTDDATFHRLFKPIMTKVMEVFSPGAVVLQCGARPCLNRHPVARDPSGFRTCSSAVCFTPGAVVPQCGVRTLASLDGPLL